MGPTPSPSPTVDAAPLAVVGSENLSTGPYTLGLVNAQGIVVAAVTANNPSDFDAESGPPLTQYLRQPPLL